MKIVLSLLQQFLEIPAATSPQQLANGLIQLGHEVDAIHTGGPGFPNVVIGHILTRVPHPNADRLGLCTVDVGEPEPRQIVCGAPNARSGLTVAVALPGAVLPGNFTITPTQIRGVQSNGMICSQRELGMGDEHTGIWEVALPESKTAPQPGTPLDTYLGPAETVLEISITPNRGDALSHLGIARDLAALGLGKLKPFRAAKPGHKEPAFTVATTTADCPQINLIELTKLKNTASPRAVQTQLEAAGLRPINAVVDATNLTMLALGQPLHAYDATKIRGGITAAAAAGGENYKGLAQTSLTLGEGDITIQDASGIIGLGGILGGEESSVSTETTSVVLEAAYFNPVRIALTGQRHQVFTDARQRFERGVDPAMTIPALLYCAHLIRTWCGGQMSQLQTAGQGVPSPQPIAYNPAYFGTLIGKEVPAPEQKRILKSLGFQVKKSPPTPSSSLPRDLATSLPHGPWAVTPPTYRTYMSTPEDLTEEILRVVGYENVTPQLPPAMPGQFQVDGSRITLDRTARRAMAAAGFLEILTYSFIGNEAANRFADGATLLTLANPLAQTEMTTLRPSLLPGLLAALQGNMAKSEPTARLAEVGKIYNAKGTESLSAAGVLAATGARHWRATEAKPDVFAAKAAAQQVLTTLGAPVESTTVRREAPGYYHPGRSGTLAIGPYTLAHFGELHPAILKAYNIPPVAVFELHLEPLLKLATKPRPWQPTPYPAVKRDLAFLLPRTVTAQDVVTTLKASNKTLLKSVEVFDSYRGEGIPADKQSLALSLTLQSPEKTLTEADITPILQEAIAQVKTKHHGDLRS